MTVLILEENLLRSLYFCKDLTVRSTSFWDLSAGAICGQDEGLLSVSLTNSTGFPIILISIFLKIPLTPELILEDDPIKFFSGLSALCMVYLAHLNAISDATRHGV